jgi:thiol-disulfide isomerase/thioredoxin
MRPSTVFVTALTLALAGAAHGQAAKLAVGDEAPGLNIDTWVKGGEVSIETGKVYVIEFWATWCAPCRKSIPHLTELQKKYGRDKLVVVGISTEASDIVEPFVTQQGDRMDYTVATDRRNATNRAWMKAAGLSGIPAVFVVDQQGRIAYIGSPLEEAFDAAIASVMSGRYDPVLQARAEPILKSARRARKVRNWRMALRHYDEVIDLSARVFADVAIERFKMILLDMKDPEAAYDYARKELVGKLFAADSGALRMLAVEITTNPEIDRAGRDLDVAMTAARQSLQLEGPVHPRALSTAALVHFHRGELREAIELQTEAYFRAEPRAKSGYRRVLSSYREAAGRASTDSSSG